jgi:hypothetical protein
MGGEGGRLQRIADDDDLFGTTVDRFSLRQMVRDAGGQQWRAARIVIAGVGAGVFAPAAAGDLSELVIGELVQRRH